MPTPLYRFAHILLAMVCGVVIGVCLMAGLESYWLIVALLALAILWYFAGVLYARRFGSFMDERIQAEIDKRADYAFQQMAKYWEVPKKEEE